MPRFNFRILLGFLKIIGVLLFMWILMRIDRVALLEVLRHANLFMIAAAFVIVILSYLTKAARWHLLVRLCGASPTFHQSWRLYNVGVFLALITPAKLGELGRAAYLRGRGMHAGTALTLSITDRLADAAAITCIAMWAVALLFGSMWALIGLVGVGIASLILWALSGKMAAVQWLSFLKMLRTPAMITYIMLWTTLSWTLYFVWTILIARSIGIDLSALLLVAALTIAGIVALLPIAPSGLGTRDAALLTLLLPFGLASGQIVAFSLLIFLMIFLSGIPGFFYWIQGTG
ncbi:MAG: lysylphosphatidylglycerol synthase transmembrane domain-containing protein [Candidatus Peribacteraceae bacterium]|nr:lysylphosphatidylglycerol synthase transmembrane domain-containing protein [Candidatus Peribacteraceae bacterium]